MRFAGLCLLTGTMLLCACPAGPTDCASDADCAPEQYCDLTLGGVRGFCRPAEERPPDGGPPEDDGGPVDDGGAPGGDGGPSPDGGGAPDGGPVQDGGAFPDGGPTPDGGGPDGGADGGGGDADGDGILDGADNCPGAFNPLQEDQDLDGVGDACDSCPSIANPRNASGVQDPTPCHPRAEVEPNGTGEATPVTVPAVFSGVVSPPGDLDGFAFAVGPGTILRLEVDPENGDLNAAVLVTGLDAANASFVRWLDDPTERRLSREVFFAAGGRYAVFVTDARNALWKVGGTTFPYRLTVSQAFLPADIPRIETVPGTVQGSLPSRGGLRFFHFVPPAGGLTRLEVTALRAPGSDLDAALTVYDPSAARLAAENRDQDDETPDPRVVFTAQAGHTYLVVVDAQGFTSAPGTAPRTAFRLDASAAASSPEIEPNESASTASPLALPGGTQGGIDRSRQGVQVGDHDAFRLAGALGTLLRLSAQPTGSDLDAVLTLYDPSGRIIAGADDPADRSAVLEVLLTMAGEHVVFVEDAVNAAIRAGQPGAPVGGAGYGYTLSAEMASLLPVAIGDTPAPGTVPRGGSAWYEVTPSASGILTVRVQNAAGGLSPWVRLYDRTTYAPLAEGPPPLDRFVASGRILVGVSDAKGAGGAGFTFEVSAALTPTVPGTAIEPDSRTLAATLAAPAAHVAGALSSAADVDYYKINLTFPASVTFGLQGAAAAGALLRLYGPAGNLVAESGSSAMLREHSPQRAGDHVVEVLNPAGATGEYLLTARVEGCPSIPGTRRPTGSDPSTPPPFADRLLLLSEVLPAPATGTDANGDGVLDNTEEELVELYNPTPDTLDLGGIAIHDETAQRFVFPCGTRLAAKTAAVVFAGGRPLGDFGGSPVFSAELVSLRQKLSLNNDNGSLKVTDPAGNMLEQFSWGSSGGICGSVACALDLDHGGQSLVRHTTIEGASGSFTPGRRPSGGLFDGAAPPPGNDLCGGAQAIAVDLSQPLTLTGDATTATPNYPASCGLPARDVVYTFSPAAPVSLDLFPSPSVRSLVVRTACDRDAPEVPSCATGPLSLDALAPGTYALFLQADGAFKLRVEFGSSRTTATHVECQSAIDLSGGGIHAASTRAGGLPFDSPCTVERNAEPALWYQIALPEPRSVRIEVLAAWNPVLTLLDGCAGRAVACGGPVLDLPSLAPGTYKLAVSGRGVRDGDSGPFDLSVAVDAALPAPVRDQCERAPTASGLLAGETTAGASDNYRPPPGAACGALQGAMPGPDLLYPVSLGAGETLTAVATPATGSNLDVALYLVSACLEVGACLAGVDAAGPGAAETLTYTNGTSASVVYLIVDSRLASSRAAFDLDLRVQ